MKILDDLESKAKAATPGPWKPGHWSGQCHMDHRHGRGNCDYQYTFVEPAPDNCGWSTICMSNEPVQHITTCDEYGSLSKEDSKYIASASPDVVLKLLAVVRAAIELGENSAKAPIHAWKPLEKALEPFKEQGKDD